MARENQGLKITVIVCILLLLVLSVVSFFLYKSSSEATLRADQADQKAQELATELANEEDANARLKELIGFAPTDTEIELATVEAQFESDMNQYAETYGESERSYRGALSHLSDSLQQKTNALSQEVATNEDLTTRLTQLQQITDAEIEKFSEARAEAEATLASERSKFNTDRQGLTEDKEKLLAQKTALANQKQKEIAKLESDVQQEQELTQKVAQVNANIASKLEAFRQPTFERPDGEIRWVNQTNGTVWINIGRLDDLQRRTNFSVYDPKISDVSRDASKGSVEVTQILGDHLAEARILADEIANPIMPGDLIHTPIWKPGEKQRFALTNGIDIDDDGEDDTTVVRNLIRSNGGVVDAYVNEEGEIVGEMTSDTLYLVVGDYLTETSSEAVIESRTQLETKADQLGVHKISLEELLRRMGWKDVTPVTGYGRYAKEKDLRMNPESTRLQESSGIVSGLYRNVKKENVKSSNGAVTELFRKRTPPTKMKSAYDQ